jgi:hypothetical protein
MDSSPTESLFTSIGAYLRSCRGNAEADACRRYWETHCTISAAEIEMLAQLGNGALCADAIAPMLGRDVACTHDLLEGLVAVGILERTGDCYAATPAAKLYCWAVTKGQLPETE